VVPAGPTGRKNVHFKSKKVAQKFYRACQRELKKSGRVKAVDFLTSGHKLHDALCALRILRDKDTGPWQNRLRRSASLLVMLEENIAREPGSFVEPRDRAIELSPALHRLVVALARRKGADVNDLVAAYLSRALRQENEALVSGGEERVRKRGLYEEAA
jgi:hypothetical protein